MLQLTDADFENLRSQFATSSQWGGRQYPPYAFTEQGVAMLPSALRSTRAVCPLLDPRVMSTNHVSPGSHVSTHG
jgi:hypothetical protein